MKKIFFLLALVSTLLVSAQADNINWSSIQLQKKLSEKTTFNFKPIVRFNNDFSEFQNGSIDISVNRKLGKGWSAQLATRTWFIPDAKPRQFIWIDAAYGFKIKNIKIDQRARMHWALDINDREDADFIRYSLRFMYNKGKKVKPFIGVEPWFRLNDVEQWQRVRYMPGVSWAINNKYGLTFMYWRENSINLKPGFKNNIWALNFLVKI